MAASQIKSAGRVGVQAVPITAGFAGELRRDLKALEASLKIKIDAEIDTSRLRATLEAFQDKYTITVKAVLDNSNIHEGMKQQVKQMQREQNGSTPYNPDFDIRPWKRYWKQVEDITDAAEKRLGNSADDQAKRRKLAAKREALESKIFSTIALTPESQSESLKSLDKEIKALRKQYDGEFELRVDYNEKSGKDAIKKLDSTFNAAMGRLNPKKEAKEIQELVKSYNEFNKAHKNNLKLGAISSNYSKSLPAMEEILDKLEKTGVTAEVKLEPIDQLTIDRYKKEINERFGLLEANIDPKLNDSDKVRKDLAEARRKAMEGVDDLEATMILGLSSEHAREEVKRLVHDINGQSVGLSVDANVLAASVRLREFMTRPRTATIHVDANTKKAALQMKAFVSSVTGVTTANKQFERMNQLLTNASSIIPKVAAGSAAIGGIGAAAVSSIAGVASLLKDMEKLLGVIGLIPAGVAGIAVMGGTLLAAFNGVGAAVARLAEDRAGGGGVVRNAKVQAIQIAQAQRRIATAHENAADATVSANERMIETAQAVKDAELEQAQDRIRSTKAVVDAQRSLDDANRDAGKVEAKLTETREKAVEAFLEQERKLENAILTRRDAEIKYQQALQAYESASTDSSVSSDALSEIELARDKAAQALKDSKAEEKDLGKEVKKNAALGVDSAESVLAANDAVAEAKDRILRAEESLGYAQTENDTNAVKYAGRVRNAILDEYRARKSADDQRLTSARAILEAEEAMFMLESQRTDTASRAADAMAALTPEGRRAAEAFLHVREMLSEVKAIIQENFFAGFTTPMVNMVEKLLPQLKSGMGNVSTVMGQGWGTFFSSVEKALGGGVLERILGNLATSIERGNKAIEPLVQAFTTITDIGMQLMPQIATTFAEWAARWNEFIQASAADGSLKQWMQDGIDGFKEFARILEGIYGIFTAIAGAAEKAGGMDMKSLGDSLNATAEFMKGDKFQTALGHVFKGADTAMGFIADGMKAIGDVFVKNGPAIEKLIGSLGGNLGKILELVAKVMGDPKFMNGMQQFLDGAGKGIDRLIEAAPQIATFMGMMMEIGGKLAELFGAMFAEIYKMVGPILELLTPIIKFLIDFLIFAAPVIAFFIPVGKIFFGITTAFKLFGLALKFVTKFLDDLAIKGTGASKVFEGIGGIVEKILPGLGKWIGELGPNLAKWFGGLVDGAGKWLSGAGPAIIAGFTAGILGAFPKLKEAVGWVMEQVNRFFPHSPALEGAFSGKGWTPYSGAALINGFTDGIQNGASGLRNAVSGLMDGAKTGLDGAMRNVSDFGKDLLNNLGFDGDELVNSGKSLMRGLGEGIKSVSPQLYNTLQGVMANVRKYFPYSPAKIGPFSGKGYTTFSGRALATDFAKGIAERTGEVSKASLGLVSAVEMPRSIQIPKVSMDALKEFSAGGLKDVAATNITNNLYEVVSAKATALETNRLQKAKVA